MTMIEKVWNKARQNSRAIVLPEGDEPRTVQAAARVRDEGLARPILLGDPERIKAMAIETNTDLGGIEIINPADSGQSEAYAEALYGLRRAKGLSREDAVRLAAEPMYYGMLMVKLGDADGLVSGAVHTTGDMLRPALQIIKTRPGISVVSSSFLMNCPNRELGEDGLLVYADCVVVPCPTARELAEIAVTAADTARVLCGIDEPRVALLSFSTKGSAKHELVSKVQQASAIAHEMAPELILDG
ncbi:MAG: phosphate acetyltransferase, partial [Clostridia bacterium]|nr:phosphate acetyltransferase [Clostridia bacterium]